MIKIISVLIWLFVLGAAIFTISVPNNPIGIALGFFALGGQTVNIIYQFVKR